MVISPILSNSVVLLHCWRIISITFMYLSDEALRGFSQISSGMESMRNRECYPSRCTDTSDPRHFGTGARKNPRYQLSLSAPDQIPLYVFLMNKLHTNMDISIKISISQSIIIAKFAIKTFLISLSILLHSGKYQQAKTI